MNEGTHGTVVLVTNGTYQLSSQIVVANNVTVRSVNGPAVTTIDGNNATRCVWLGHDQAVLDGFTVTKGYVAAGTTQGTGVLIDNGGTVQNCVVTGNVSRTTGRANCRKSV